MADHIFEILESLGGEFVRTSGGKQIWEFSEHKSALEAIKSVNAKAWNWCPIQQPKGANARRSQVSVTF